MNTVAPILLTINNTVCVYVFTSASYFRAIYLLHMGWVSIESQ